ncbi:putative diacylglycerol O-acyltransferase tgs1 [Stygiomarasmius scandens]|uniref:Trimethylguanosine synthase n=1 Tax=Marasmiellus scandens TaxID=2682957 RepID=A0ABR1JIV4_9AGAR
MGKRKGNTKTFGGLAGFLTTLDTGTVGSISPQPDAGYAAAKWEKELVDVEKGNKNGKEGAEEIEEERSGKRRRVDGSVSGIDHGENGTSSGAETIAVSRSVVKKGTGWDDWEEGWIKKYDMSGSVRHLEQLEGLDDQDESDGLKKYFAQRYKLFSLYSSPPGCLLDKEGWYSVTPEAVAKRIAERCRCDTILDAFCGVGGNAIQFALTCNRVITFDISVERLKLARHNAMIYGVEERIEFVLGDFVEWAKCFVQRQEKNRERKIDVVFLSPPWGGPDYLSLKLPLEEEETKQEDDEHALYSLSSVQPIHGADLFRLARKITPNVAYYLPRNMDLNEAGGLVSGDEYVEIEEEWTGTRKRDKKLKALTCYYGGLVNGQEGMF